MLDTFLGVLGIGASFAGLYTGRTSQQQLMLRLDDVETTVSQLHQTILRQIEAVPNAATRRTWEGDTEEIAYRLYNELRNLSQEHALPIILELIGNAPNHGRPRKAATSFNNERAIRIAFQDAPVVVGPDNSTLVRQIAHVAEQRGRETFENVAPIFLRTPEAAGADANDWKKKLFAIAPDQVEEKSVHIDKTYWSARLDSIV